MTKTIAAGTLLIMAAAPQVASSQDPPAPAKISDDNLHTVSALVDGRAFVRIPAGEFLMGSAKGNPDEQPPHRVRITHSFEMGKFEVTQAQWEAVMRDPHGPGVTKDVNPSHFKGPARPVENVSWDAVQQFLQRLNKRDQTHLYRLPTEAEWEYACRAGQTESDTGDLEEIAWFESSSSRQTHTIGGKKPNRWGLHDMLGNVAEWVEDWYAPDSYANADDTDPTGPASSSYKVHRGCAWLSAPAQCRPTFRGFDFPNPGQYSTGFRIVRTRR